MRKEFYLFDKYQKVVLTKLFPNIKEEDVVNIDHFYCNYLFSVGNTFKNVIYFKNKNFNLKLIINDFIDILKRYNVDEDIIKSILFLHYSDDSLDGSGNIRFSTRKFYSNHKGLVLSINNYFKEEKDITKHIYNELLGASGNTKYVIIKDDEKYLMYDYNDFINQIINQNNVSSLYIGPFLIEAYEKNISRNNEKEYLRKFVRIRIQENKIMALIKEKTSN